MASAHPPELVDLLNATDPAAREAAWETFVGNHSRLLLHTARSQGRDHDTAMDAYAFLLEQLHAGDFHRLRAYADDGRCKFTTWLVVVARRLCLDHHRQRYGRVRDAGPQRTEERIARRRLTDLIAEELDGAALSAAGTPNPEAEVVARERGAVLTAALAALEARDRLLLKLRFEDDLPAREIGQVMGLATPFHVYRRLNALLSALRRALEGRGVDGAGA